MIASAAKPTKVITISRNEMKSRARGFAKDWAGPQKEESDAKTFVDKFFGIFGRDRRNVDARFEHHVVLPSGDKGRIDLFWPGKLVIEMKSTGRDLGAAYNQAIEYVDSLDADERPRWVLVSDFAKFVLYDLGEEVHELLKGMTASAHRKPTLAAAFTLDELADNLRYFAFIREVEQDLFLTVSVRPASS